MREGFIFMFSTKRLGLLLAALLVATMSFGVITSGAWFTDSDTVAVTATSGGIEVQWSGPNANGFSVSNLMPANGFANAPKTPLSIYNTGSSDSAVKFRVTDSMTSESVSGFYSQLWVHVEEIDCGATSVVRVAYSGPLEDLNFDSIGAKYDPLGINFTDCYTFQFALSQFAGNEFQNQSATFDLVLDATQPENPGWSE
jgi:hypothetical protein